MFVWFFLLLFVFFFPVLAVRCVLCVVESFAFSFVLAGFLLCLCWFGYTVWFCVFVSCCIGAVSSL
jgi:hypothetical protein